MKPIQWLLIGGEGHGKTLWIKAGNSVCYPCKNSFDTQEYVGKDYVHHGQIFRIGEHNATPEQVAQIPRLIVETQLEPFNKC